MDLHLYLRTGLKLESRLETWVQNFVNSPYKSCKKSARKLFLKLELRSVNCWILLNLVKEYIKSKDGSGNNILYVDFISIVGTYRNLSE